MNPRAILSLLSDLYSQLTAAQDRVTALEEELARLKATRDKKYEAEPDEAPPASSP